MRFSLWLVRLAIPSLALSFRIPYLRNDAKLLGDAFNIQPFLYDEDKVKYNGYYIMDDGAKDSEVSKFGLTNMLLSTNVQPLHWLSSKLQLEDVLRQALEEQRPGVFLHPGGNAKHHALILRRDGMKLGKLLKKAVEEGSAVIAICAGGYNMAQSYTLLDRKNRTRIHEGLGIVDATAEKAFEHKCGKAMPVNITLLDEFGKPELTFPSIYNGGAVLTPSDDTGWITLARFADDGPRKGEAAVSVIPVGKGMVLLSAIHFESPYARCMARFEQELENMFRRNLHELLIPSLLGRLYEDLMEAKGECLNMDEDGCPVDAKDHMRLLCDFICDEEAINGNAKLVYRAARILMEGVPPNVH